MNRGRCVAGLLGVMAWIGSGSLVRAQSFDVASVKVAVPDATGISCSGGPGTGLPNNWRCSNIPLALVISKAFRFQDFQFSAHDPCCLSRFDFDVRVPAGSTREQFDRMLQNLLRERFGLTFHYARKQMPIYQLERRAQELKLKPADATGADQSEEPWWTFGPSTGYKGYGRRQWTARNVSAQDLARVLENELVRPVVDATQLHGRYDVDLKWVVDNLWNLSAKSRAELIEQLGEIPEKAPGPSIFQAVQEQLGLQLKPGKGFAQVVVIDRLYKVPTEN
jgi:uncharacterized protein (TIGR03435 family)